MVLRLVLSANLQALQLRHHDVHGLLGRQVLMGRLWRGQGGRGQPKRWGAYSTVCQEGLAGVGGRAARQPVELGNSSSKAPKLPQAAGPQ